MALQTGKRNFILKLMKRICMMKVVESSVFN
jgi:hypothetical protein